MADHRDTDDDAQTEPDPFGHGRRRDTNGHWPGEDLSAEPPSVPELGEYATDRQLARAYGTITVTWYRLWPRIVESLQWLYGAVMGAKASADGARDLARDAFHRLSEKIDAIHARVHAEPTFERRRKLPSLSEYNPEHTPAGGVRVEEHQWEAIQQQIARLDAAATVADAEKRGAAMALAAVEAKTKKFRDSVRFWAWVIGILVPVAIAAVHFLKL